MSIVTSTRRVTYNRLWWVTLLTAVAAAVLSAIVFLISSAQGAFPETIIIPPAEMPISLPPVIFTSVMGVIGGAVTYAVIGRISQKPVRVFRILAGIVLVLSFAAPLSISDAPLGFYLALEIMHVIAGVVTIWGLTTYASHKH